MHSSTLLRRALAPAIAAVLSAGVLAAVLGAAQPAPAEVALGRAAVVFAQHATPADPLTTASSGDAPVALTTGTTAPPPAAAPTEAAAPAPAPAPAPPAPAPSPAPEPAAPAPAPAPSAAPAPAPVPAPAPAPAPARQPTSSFARVTSCEANVLRWMNEVRASNGLGALTSDPGIQWVAVSWSDSMASRQQLSHNPDFGGKIFAERPQAMSASENVGRTTGSDRSVFDGFLQSPPHRAEILSSVSTHTTVGCVHDGNQLWVTVNFWG